VSDYKSVRLYQFALLSWSAIGKQVAQPWEQVIKVLDHEHRAVAVLDIRSAEPFYEPSTLTPLGKTSGSAFERPYSGRRSGAALRRGSAPARRPTPPTVTFLLSRAPVGQPL
jgi:hypothetical protein